MQLCFRGSTDLFPLPRDMLPSFLSSRSTRRRNAFDFSQNKTYMRTTRLSLPLCHALIQSLGSSTSIIRIIFYVLGLYSRHQTSLSRRLHWHPTYHIQRISSHLAASFRQPMFHYHQIQFHCIERKSALQPPFGNRSEEIGILPSPPNPHHRFFICCAPSNLRFSEHIPACYPRSIAPGLRRPRPIHITVHYNCIPLSPFVQLGFISRRMSPCMSLYKLGSMYGSLLDRLLQF